MSDQISEEKSKSFSLTQHKSSEDKRVISWEELAYDRLKILYRVSKLFSSFESIDSIEETFPPIFNLAAETLPVATFVLVDHWTDRPKNIVWHSAKATHEQTMAAALNANQVYEYLSHPEIAIQEGRENCIVLPLIVDGLPAQGALQIEGTAALNEKDLEFVDALAGLIAVALDRYYKSLIAQDLRSAKEKLSSEKVSGLETERDLREGFVSLLTHDLRTPLSAAKMAAQLVSGNANENKDLVIRIVRNINRADEMISNLLDANRIRGGEKLPLSLEKLDLALLVKETLTELNLVHGERFVFKGEAQVNGTCDPGALRRIVENLCSNAVKYGATDLPVVVELIQNEKNIIISVQNQGPLISLKDQKSIFQQFRRSDSAQAGKKPGWGIGLTLVKGLSEAHGGSVSVKSEADSVTVFTVTLPLLRD